MGINTLMKSALAVALLAMAGNTGVIQAQTQLPAYSAGLVANVGSTLTLEGPGACETSVPMHYRSGAKAISSDKWLTAVLHDGELTLTATSNSDAAERYATVSLTNVSGQTIQVKVVQPGRSFDPNTDTGMTFAKPTSAKDNNHNGSEDISKTLDGDVTTLYHCNYNGFAHNAANCPVLTYEFANGTTLEAIRYTPRQSGNNGHFGEVDILVKTGSDYELALTHDFGMVGNIATVDLPASYAGQTIYGVQFKVRTGRNDNGDGATKCFASCAEMEFIVYKQAPEHVADMNLFSDAICSSLKPGVTAAQVEGMSNPTLKMLAQDMLSGNYDAKGRISTHEPLMHTADLSALWNAPGKQYDRLQGVTGVIITPGTSVFMVDGIPSHIGSVELKIYGWDSGEGNEPREAYYKLTNGLNVIKHNQNWEGLAYVTNFDTKGLADGTASDIKVHVLYGKVNGVVSHDYTNEEIAQILANAKYACIDCVGKRVHSVWEVAALRQYAADEWIRYLNSLDVLIFWEHRTLGLEKYNRVPTNKTFAYVNHTYYMFQGNLGVSFKENTQYRVCSPQNIMHNDDDVVWGLSHEWGHQHQMHPYMTWGAMAEVTNNLFSYTNIMKMGYYRSAKINEWPGARETFIKDKTFGTTKRVSTARNKGYQMRSRYSWNPDFAALMEQNKDSVIPSVKANKLRAVHHSENGVGQALCPFIMLSNYALLKLNLPDFLPDLHEAMRQNDLENGSTVEKQSGLDKYELLARAQNYNKNNAIAQYRAAYPTSVWTTGEYITEQHCGSFYENSIPFVLNFVVKTSRLTGYNLFPYFEQWGYLRVLGLYYGDYGDTFTLFTQAAYDEFKADMDAMVASGELKAMPEGMVEEISNTRDLNLAGDLMYQTPDLPNDRPVSANDY